METVTTDAIDPETTDEHRTHDRRVLTDALNTSDLAVVHYTLEPGERFSGTLHTHMDQEEVFVVLAGEATFETEHGTVTVGEDEAIRFAPGEFQTGYNDSDERVVALALGGPRDSEDVRISHIAGYGDVSCSECGHDHMQVDPTTEASELVCPECGMGWE
jgi:uncharacterized cupin superfamily protein